MASEDVVGKSTGESAVTTIVNLAEEAKLAREEIKRPGYAVLSICKSLVAGGVAGGVDLGQEMDCGKQVAKGNRLTVHVMKNMSTRRFDRLTRCLVLLQGGGEVT